MSRVRTSLRHGVTFAFATALTTWFALLTWRGFAEEAGAYLRPLLMLGLAITLLGAWLRWLRLPILAVPAAQLLFGALAMVLLFGNDKGGGNLPSPSTVRATVDAVAAAVETARSFAAPIPQDAIPVAPLLVACGALGVILVDFLAGTLGRVPLSGLALLMVYTLPVTVWGNDIPWGVFVLTAGGFMYMLFLREQERFAQWGREITGYRASDSGFGTRRVSARGSALRTGSIATAAALILPALIPTLDLALFGDGPGSGSGDSVTIVNPMTDLRRDLKQGPDVPVLTVTTDERDPSYLRYSVLTSFNGREWTTGDRSIPDDQVADGRELPDPFGVDPDVGRSTYLASYETADRFRSGWLPVPFPAADVSAPGVWKYDVSTMDFLSGDHSFANGLRYRATGIALDLTRDELISARRAPKSLVDVYTRLPAEIPQLVRELAFDVTAGRSTSFERAAALQDWFRGSGDFTYSLETSSGNGSDDLAAFLQEGPDGRRGYCEQFASAMAVMARILGIPARVAVGFLRPTPGEIDDTFVYSSRDLHAWPELYFEGAGWVRFEPTPGGRTGQAPDYTQGGLSPSTPTELPSGNATSQQPSGDATATRKPVVPLGADGAASTGGSGFPWVAVLLGLLGAVLLGVLAMVPRTLRRGRTEARWRVGTAETAWAELRDAATDLGLSWPHGRSPRATAEVLALQFAGSGSAGRPGRPGRPVRPVRGPDTNPEAMAALERLVHALEVERYSARALEVPRGELRDDVTTCVAALRNGVPERTRRRADWLPLSLGPGGRPGGRRSARPNLGDVEASNDQGQVVEHVGG